ncbi:DNA recombination protein RmuC [uncultured Helicobacter sp.]|uniref:DNA recombination protein RmuC n=1 Tax=uncultured Helicobacter sp. TaxID=175537 RepID=UPI0026075607|nr:DNA recombination protein RmuC [uncultured Helicobacter sp.]
MIAEMISIGCIGLICGALGMWIWQKSTLKALKSTYQYEIEQYKTQIQSLSTSLTQAQSNMQMIESSSTQRLEDMQRHFEERIAQEKTHAQQLLQHLQEQYTLTQEEAQKREEKNKEELKNAFKALGADILQKNTQIFNENQTLSLQPLKDEISRFSKQLYESHTSTIKQHTTLSTQIEQLHKLNMQLSTDAHNLTNALKGENKTQGNWGEIILQSVFESSGLKEGREYELQANMHDEEHNKLRPDAIIKLPRSNGEERCVIVDAKTSLIAYERLCNAQSEQDRILAQKDLADSIRTHFKGLSLKGYQQYTQGQKLDFVLMFIPIDGAFLEAMQHNANLYDEAYQKGVVLVSPTTIMAVLKIINNLWQMEYRNKNIDKIFEEIHRLFESIRRFEGTLEKLGQNIGTLSKTYEDVMKKYEGNQGIANKSEKIQQLLKGAGVESIESLPSAD